MQEEKTRQTEEALIKFETDDSEELKRREIANKQRAINKRKNSRATKLLMFITCFACIHLFATVQYLFDHYVDCNAFSELILCWIIDFGIGVIFGFMAEYIERRINK